MWGQWCNWWHIIAHLTQIDLSSLFADYLLSFELVEFGNDVVVGHGGYLSINKQEGQFSHTNSEFLGRRVQTARLMMISL